MAAIAKPGETLYSHHDSMAEYGRPLKNLTNMFFGRRALCKGTSIHPSPIHYADGWWTFIVYVLLLQGYVFQRNISPYILCRFIISLGSWEPGSNGGLRRNFSLWVIHHHPAIMLRSGWCGMHTLAWQAVPAPCRLVCKRCISKGSDTVTQFVASFFLSHCMSGFLPSICLQLPPSFTAFSCRLLDIFLRTKKRTQLYQRIQWLLQYFIYSCMIGQGLSSYDIY